MKQGMDMFTIRAELGNKNRHWGKRMDHMVCRARQAALGGARELQWSRRFKTGGWSKKLKCSRKNQGGGQSANLKELWREPKKVRSQIQGKEEIIKRKKVR